MPNTLFNALGGSQNGLIGEFNTFMQNPANYLLQKRVGIPQQYMNNPRDAVQYLLNNGRMTQEQFNRLSQMAQQMGMHLN